MGTSLNVFISRPSSVGEAFEAAYSEFDNFLVCMGLTPRRLGKSDYSRRAPLHAVIEIMDECCGAIVLGYPQIEVRNDLRRGSQVQSSSVLVFPTPWNQIEGALAFRCSAPVLVVAGAGISGGVFDHGVTGEMVLNTDLSHVDWFRQSQFSQPFQQWLGEVRNCAQRRSRPDNTECQ